MSLQSHARLLRTPGNKHRGERAFTPIQRTWQTDRTPGNLRPTARSSDIRVTSHQASGSRVQSTSSSSTPAQLGPTCTQFSKTYTPHSWKWKGHKINYVTAGCGEPILLVHGFGASAGHYRRLIPVLAKQYKVYAIDLLGFGASDKPVQPYTIELWAELIDAFLAEFMDGKPAVLVGNSVGSLCCLTAAAKAAPHQVRGLVLLNAAGAMNNKGVVSDWRIIAAYPIFLLIDLLLSTRSIARPLFDNFRQKETLQKVLLGVYKNAAAVDDELVEIIHRPSCDANALDVFVSVITGPPGPKPWDLILKIQAPIFIAWGDTDPFTPLDGPVGIYMRDLATTRPNTTFALLKDVGHCPQDDRPELLHTELLPWLEKLMSSCSPQQLGPGAATGVVTVAAGSMQSGPNGGSLQ
eukprot:jgi/Chrzof1/11672/Cz06g04170.t1_PPH3